MRGQSQRSRAGTAVASAAATGRPSPSSPRNRGSAARSVRARRAPRRSRRRSSSRSGARRPSAADSARPSPTGRRCGRASRPSPATRRARAFTCVGGVERRVEQRVDGRAERRRAGRRDRRRLRGHGDGCARGAPAAPANRDGQAGHADRDTEAIHRLGLMPCPAAPPTAPVAGGVHARRRGRSAAWRRSGVTNVRPWIASSRAAPRAPRRRAIAARRDRASSSNGSPPNSVTVERPP